MSNARTYHYRSKSRTQLRLIADKILARFASKRRRWAVDIEAIVEELGFEVLFREMRGIPVEAYIARAPRIIVVNQDYIHYLPRYRFTLAEELSHRILEFRLWQHTDLKLPPGTRVHELSSAQYRAIERDARCLAAEILQPERDYRQRFESHRAQLLKNGIKGAASISGCVRAVAQDFEVSVHSAGYRAKVLGYVDAKTYDALFPPLL